MFSDNKYHEELKAISGVMQGHLVTVSGNGLTSFIVIFGIPFAMFIYGSYYWALRKLLTDKFVANTAFVMFMLFMWGESYTMMPICFSIIAGAFILDSNLARQNGYYESGFCADDKDSTQESCGRP